VVPWGRKDTGEEFFVRYFFMAVCGSKAIKGESQLWVSLSSDKNSRGFCEAHSSVLALIHILSLENKSVPLSTAAWLSKN
jgi:hypothetical protein